MAELIRSAYFKKPHKKGCDGSLVRYPYPNYEPIHIDKTGRVGNGGVVAYDYRCNKKWDGCNARVLVTEAGVRRLAVAIEERS